MCSRRLVLSAARRQSASPSRALPGFPPRSPDGVGRFQGMVSLTKRVHNARGSEPRCVLGGWAMFLSPFVRVQVVFLPSLLPTHFEARFGRVLVNFSREIADFLREINVARWSIERNRPGQCRLGP